MRNPGRENGQGNEGFLVTGRAAINITDTTDVAAIVLVLAGAGDDQRCAACDNETAAAAAHQVREGRGR
jgi:hypothetical protein